MIFPWTVSLGKMLEDFLNWFLGGSTFMGKSLLEWFGVGVAHRIIPTEYYHIWVCDTGDLMLYTLIVFVVGAWLGYVLHYPKKPAGEGEK